MAVETLAQALEPAMVDSEQLNKDYQPVIAIVRELIGVVPNCNPVLEIWPPAFRSFNVLIPNLLNLPAALLGQGAPKDLVGLAMYVSSRESGCMYCTAHHCSFAIRRGASLETVIENDYTAEEQAVVDVARAVAMIPGGLTKEMVDELGEYLSPPKIEWIVLAVAIGGFLNKFMDAMGIEIEDQVVADITPLLGDQGWDPGKHLWSDELPDIDANGGIPPDNIRTILRVARRAPGALRLDSAWTKGVSGRIGSALMMLEDELGYAFPILASLQHKRPVKAIAAMLRDNLSEELSEVGLRSKCMVGLVYAKVVEDEVLISEAVQLAALLAPDIDTSLLVEVGRFATSPAETASIPAGLSSAEAAAIILAKAASTSPSSVNEITISNVVEHLEPAEIVEIVVWLSMLQMLHRLYAFYDAKIGLT